jgi:hypothetical protein
MKKFAVFLSPTVLVRLACGGVIIQALCNGVSASAQTVNVSNNNSSASINLSSPTGMSNWLIDGVNILNQQSFLFRTGSGVAAPISSLGAPSVNQPSTKSLNAIYAGPQFTLTTSYSMVGGGPGSGAADLTEQIRILNTSVTPLNLVFFQFVNFAGNGNIELGQNSHGLINEAFISHGGPGLNESIDAGISPGANKGMVGDAALMMNSLLTVPGFTLGGPDTGIGAWALEWDRMIGANQSITISEDFNVTGIVIAPEPASWRIALIGLAVMGISWVYGGRKRKTKSAYPSDQRSGFIAHLRHSLARALGRRAERERLLWSWPNSAQGRGSRLGWR